VKCPFSLLLILVALTAATGPSPAAEPDPRPTSTPSFSLSPMAGYRGGGRFDAGQEGPRLDLDGAGSLALAFNIRQSRDRYYEIYYSRQSTDLDDTDLGVNLEYLHAGGMLAWPQGGFSTFLAAGIGVTRINARGAGLGSEIEPSASLALGLEIPIAGQVSLRLEGRGYLTLTDGDKEIFCLSDAEGARCRLRYEGSALTQFEALAGLRVRF